MTTPFCVRCGNQMREGAAFCSKCGILVGLARAIDNLVYDTPPPVDHGAESAAEKKRGGLILGLATIGLCVTALAIAISFGVALAFGGEAGRGFLIVVGIVASALFCASLLPSKAERFNFSNKRWIDPTTGAPLRMVWWFRWMVAMIALSTVAYSFSDDFFQTQLATQTQPGTQNQPTTPTQPILAQQEDSALDGFCGGLAGEALWDKVVGGDEEDDMHRRAILSVDKIIAKKYNISPDQADTILQLAIDERIKRHGPGHSMLYYACTP
jgi:hypothetical protein